MPARAPAFMREMLAERNSPNRWRGVQLNSIDKALIEQALSEQLERKHNDATAYHQITGLIAKLRNL